MTNKPDTWKEDFAKIWREGEQRGYDTYDPIKNFIENLLSTRTALAQKEGVRIKECLEEAIVLMEDVISGEYRPDSFTTQPWKKALQEKLDTKGE